MNFTSEGVARKRIVDKKTFDKYNIEAYFLDKDYPEIQAENSLEIAKFTAIQASKELNIPVIREDHSLFINAIGIPGPYTNYVEKKMLASEVLKILKEESDRTGYFEIATVYAEPDGFVKEWIFKVPIRFSTEEKGQLQKGWSKIIILENENRTLAEYPEEERIETWNKNYQKIAKWLISGKKTDL